VEEYRYPLRFYISNAENSPFLLCGALLVYEHINTEHREVQWQVRRLIDLFLLFSV
jgi:hypothetical protein